MKILPYLIITVIALAIGFYCGNQTPKQEVIISPQVHQIIWEMDKSCYEQFNNNLDKAIYLKLQIK